MRRYTGWQAHNKDADHLTGSDSLSVQVYMEAGLCPSDYVGTSAKVSLTSAVKNQSDICKLLMASAKNKYKTPVTL